MRKTLTKAIAVTSIFALAACNGEEAETEDTMAEDQTEEVVEEEPEETAAATDPEVEATGNVIEIQMYTRDPDDNSGMQVFKPKLVRAEVGDTVTFVPTDPTHQSSSIPEMIPDGARGWEGEINESVSYVLPLPGVYGYKCVPHYAAGMIGLIVVEGEGMTDNLEEAKAVSHPGLAGREFEEIFEEADLS